MPTKEEIEEGYRILKIETEEKRVKLNEIDKIVKSQSDDAIVWRFKTVSNIEIEG